MNLTEKLVDRMIDMVVEAKEAKYSFDGEYQKSLWIYNMNPEDVDKAIEEVQSRITGLHVITLSVEDIQNINKDYERRHNEDVIIDKLLGFNEEHHCCFDVSSLPIVPHSDVLHEVEPDDVKAATEKWESGILYVRDINKANYQTIPINFEFNLAKTHSLMDMRISRRWLIVGGSNTTLDLRNYGSRFNPADDLKD